MKKILLAISIFLCLCGCSKKDDLSGFTSDTFELVISNNKTYTTKYITGETPSENGTFLFSYNEPGQMKFWVFIDQSNELEININLPTAPVLNTVYKSNSALNQSIFVDFYLENKDVDPNREFTSEVVFTSFVYPGLIQGTVKLFKPDGSIFSSGEFYFTSKEI